MQQVLFLIPGIEWPVYGFGAMLFVTFFLVTYWASRRNLKIGLPKERTQDLAIVLFLSGIAGARVLYMIQYADEMGLRSMSPFRIVAEFFKIWNGGIVVYGAVFGGLIGLLLFRHFVLKRFRINGWQLADAIAPLLAFGMALGRIGCYLNGCCWGQVACEECQPVPISAELGRFPLITAHARKQVCYPPGEKARLPQIHGLQTPLGFATRPVDRNGASDPRTVIAAIEPGSDAEAAGLKAGDRIVEVNGGPNQIILELFGPASAVTKAVNLSPAAEVLEEETGEGGEIRSVRLAFREPSEAHRVRAAIVADGVHATLTDTLSVLTRMGDNSWPRGRKSLELTVERDGQTIPIRYIPRTVTFFPTQIYETVSMLLLTVLLLAFQPFRRHDGQVMVLMMLGYAAHRFLNEAIRIEPTYALGLTLSQWISILIAFSALCLELYLRASQPKLPPGEVPLGYHVNPRENATSGLAG